jgi:aspartate-semialdehyde dehydrogenase
VTNNMIAVVGATGLVGREVISVLGNKDHPGEAILALATGRTEGEEIDFLEETLPVEPVGSDSFRGVKAAVLAVPRSAAKALGDQARKAGAWVIDLSGAWAGDPQVPLVAQGIAGARSDVQDGRIVTLAHPVAQALALVLSALRSRGLTGADATLLLGAAAYGHVGVRMLEQQTASLLSGRDPEEGPFPHRLGFNVVPQVGDFLGRSTALEELVRLETLELFGANAPPLGITAFAVPTFHGGVLSITARFQTPPGLDAVRDALKASPELKLLDDPATSVYPMPLLATGDSKVHVGRLRVEGSALQVVAAVDLVGRAAETAATLAISLANRAP